MPPDAIGEAIGEAIAKTRCEDTGGAARGEINRSYADLGAGDLSSTSHRRWDVYYEDTTLETRSILEGSICLHQLSQWITVRDEEEDILAGRYLQQHECPKIGEALEIDVFYLIVRSPWSPQKSHEEATVCVDLTTNPTRLAAAFGFLQIKMRKKMRGNGQA
ncbi:hypothetical protein ZWY2020_023877 [Hordeum vulgare]|nr:hypothetical protein ZWY2020_023877 [Hordeum vulgare]